MNFEYGPWEETGLGKSTRLSVLRRTYAKPELAVKTLPAAPKSNEPAEGTSAQVGFLAKHDSWKLLRVITGHEGWVQSICVEPDNQWFATGSADHTIKVWDLASGKLRLTLTGHIMGVRALEVSDRMPYLFSAGEDKTVKCWDLESNRVVRDYHGHLSGVYSLSLHPTLNVLVTAGRDSVVRVWDIRTRHEIHVLQGHRGPINSVQCQAVDPQIVSGSQDSTVRLWDLAAGKCVETLTHHTKSVRSVLIHPTEFTFMSADRDAIKKWQLPAAAFMGDFKADKPRITNTLSLSVDDLLFAGGDDGTLNFYDYNTMEMVFQTQTTPVPGSIAEESGILCSSFDKSGIRLLTGEADKSIKVWGPAD
ncbi:Pre-mRNA-splicing factor PRP46 [Wickerhamiella sorbophila]|uniref:Pre-mRNA-splicing factor PRP46 n=1 Tax=Wickerhamiella sorbophila TaxID=45607 RepID=A0A2T0FP16_9ASCO|nr:Pre-mRNA-splicing factor PRP46 [Wickerhamiella sorbophila]PRT56732.1 Pre-mRNA-splicing factor PRP46 [Wickerhamiella sorbophila]